MKTNGKDKDIVVENVDPTLMTISDNWIYYFDNSYFYRIKTNGEEKKRLSNKSIESYEIVENWIYYSYKNDGKYVIAKMKANGEDNTKIDTETGKAFLVRGNYIYYIYENYDYENYEYSYELYKMKINGKDKKKVADIGGNVDINTVNFNENAVYYTKKDENGNSAIHKMDLNGKNETKIVDIEAYSTNINLHDNWIYYPDEDENGDVQMFRIKTNGEDKQNLSL